MLIDMSSFPKITFPLVTELCFELRFVRAKKLVLFFFFLTSQQVTNAGEGVEKKVSSFTLGGNVNWYKHYGKQYGDT